MALQLVPSIVLPYFIEWIERSSDWDPSYTVSEYISKNQDGFIYAGIISGAVFLEAFFDAHAKFAAQELTVRIKSALMMLVYDKSLTIAAADSPTPGKILTLITSDAVVISYNLPIVINFALLPVQLIAILVLMWRQIKYYSLVNLGILLLALPITGWIGAIMMKIFTSNQEKTDARIKLTTELLHAIRIVKYYAWENAFRKNILAVRAKELKILRSAFNWIGGMYVALGGAPIVGMGVTFILYATFETPSLPVIFTTLTLINLLRWVFVMLPTFFQSGAFCLASMNRIEGFLNRKDSMKVEFIPATKQKPASVSLSKASFKWTEEDSAPFLKDLTLKLSKKSLMIISGPVGSGKTCFLDSILRNTHLSHGTCEVNGSVAYVPQTSWVMNATLKNNILFGYPYDEERYRRVVHACSLKSDFKLMPAGDETEIGERGVNLSGGQKQRISIARALYSKKDIYVFDDPLSAVDSHVSKHIFKHAIREFLKDELVLFVTNNLSFLPEADQVVYLENGTLQAVGRFSSLIKSNQSFKKLMNKHGVFKKRPVAAPETVVVSGPSAVASGGVGDNTENGLVYEGEMKEEGLVSFGVYYFWLKQTGFGYFAFLLLAITTMYSSVVVSAWWLQRWVSDIETAAYQNMTTTEPLEYYIGIYAGINIVTVIMSFAFLMILIQMVLASSKRLHMKGLEGILNAPISFFDTTPIGRILSRFSSDLTILDSDYVEFLYDCFDQLFSLVAALCSIALAAPWILIAVPFFVILYIYIQYRFRHSSIEIQRLESLTRAPLFSHFSETLTGMTIVRTYMKQEEFMRDNVEKTERNVSVMYALRFAQGWFGLVLGLVSALLQMVAFGMIVSMKMWGNAEAGLLSVALSFTPQITMNLKMFSIASAQLEVAMNAVERIRDFTVIEPEPGLCLPEVTEEWPSKGLIEFNDFSFRYREGLPLVLKKINLKIQGGERIGIIGRTGSGKSTLMQALYRFADASSGSISIDGVDTQSLQSTQLRGALSIIPQEPQLFIGSVRYNIDPFENFTDDEVWQCLEIAGLKDFVSSLESKLETEVQMDGANFSVGQKQLFCLARALLRKSKILVLDEATASVDYDTGSRSLSRFISVYSLSHISRPISSDYLFLYSLLDILIQKAIRKHFPGTTILVIAHRLNTVMDLDKILGLDAGAVLEFDSPKKLANDHQVASTLPANTFVSLR
eukprot:TRINITY_DN287_c0_g1_i1.p1 TRINITY_DN287_c0_g1~~TRINITY_DN287_c0_g1_i1.p1  ORF type:complete len:1308 (+),score=249.92 TRINITY_DN287_c0_g1_i1:336-3926(+)